MEVVVLVCQQTVPDPDALKTQWSLANVRLRVLSEPCSSKLEAFQLFRTLTIPVDLIWVIGCEESLCRFDEGSQRTSGRIAYTKKYLGEIGLEPARVGRSVITPGDQSAMKAVIFEIQDCLKSLGASPLRQAQKTAARQSA